MPARWPDVWPPEIGVVLALTPHPDDELFCAGLLARATSAGVEVELVCATGGQRGAIFGERAAPDEVSALRAGELRTAAAALGIATVRLLDFDDGDLDDRAADTIAESIDQRAPDLIVTYGADGGYGHRDHVALVSLTAAALGGRTRRPRWLQRLFRPGDFGSLAGHLRRSAPELLADVDIGGSSIDEVDWIVDVAPVEAARRAAIDAHASQRFMLDRLPALSAAEEWYRHG